ncbi:MAG: hypothetical protein GX797_05330 [Chloroflexi bacterium]|jgi:heme/copper-type cytochrome/quinol oxidase subunit 2|nr:hypothetical protein [Chloroflexota bacterium]
METKDSNNYFETPAIKAHKQQRTWQILLPILAAGFIVLLVMVWLILMNGRINPDISDLAGVSVVLLSLPFFLLALIKLIVLVGIIFGLSKLKPLVPKAGISVLQAFEKARWHIRKGADISVQPILGWNQNREKAKQVFESLHTRLIDKRN